MVAVKGKSSSFTNQIVQETKTSKNVSRGRSFKVHSETGKVRSLSSKESIKLEAKKSLPPNASRNTVGALDMKAKVGTAIISEKTKSKHEGSVNLRSTRKALADISNVKRNVVETKLRNKAKIVSSMGPDIKIGKPSMGETRRGQAQTSNSSYSLRNADNKDMKTTSVVQKSKAQGSAFVTTASRTSGRNPLHQTRSSLPLKPVNAFVTTASRTSGRNPLHQTRSSLPLKSVNKVAASDANKGSAESLEEGRPKYAFPVKPKVGRYAVPPQATHSRRSFLGYRASDGFLLMASSHQAKVDSGLSSMKSTKISKIDCASHDQQNKKLKDKKRGTMIIPSVSKSQRKLKSSVSNKLTLRSSILSNEAENARQVSVSDHITSDVSVADQSAEMQTSSGCKSMLDISLENSSRTKSLRRKSFTSSLMEKPKLFGEVTKRETLPNIYDDRNHLEVAEYVDDLYHYYWVMEAHVQPLKNYMQIQTEISAQMRAILVNWLIEVHLKFDLMQETLFLMVTLLDQYLSVAVVKKNELQLVALTALLLASKYEDFWHPRVMDLIGISAQSYTRQQILQMEREFLRKLKFRLNMPTPYVFMLRFLKAAQSNEKFEHLAFYLIELCLVQHEAVNYRPSMLCASAIYLARNTLQLIPPWTPLLVEHAHYQISEIRECAEMMLKVHQAARSSQLKVTYEKYMRSDHSRVAAIEPLDVLPI
ncbi:hypothetical protein LIER_23346 [Lithospermum erythrorhizon]|uniref:B-like cyclin n=1 Tax=Lithospermum erythrorhizon TaxID=34254 RepID=A0AAV3QYG6_LITER